MNALDSMKKMIEEAKNAMGFPINCYLCKEDTIIAFYDIDNAFLNINFNEFKNVTQNRNLKLVVSNEKKCKADIFACVPFDEFTLPVISKQLLKIKKTYTVDKDEFPYLSIDELPYIHKGDCVNGYVYVIHINGTNQYKIGFTRNWQKREIGISSNNKNISVVMLWYGYFAQELERFLHAMVLNKSISGEWFELEFKDFIMLNYMAIKPNNHNGSSYKRLCDMAFHIESNCIIKDRFNLLLNAMALPFAPRYRSVIANYATA